MVKTGGLGESIADLPVAGAAPEWMSEKAICIGQYFVASGVFTVFGATFPIVEETKFHKHLFQGLEAIRCEARADDVKSVEVLLAPGSKELRRLGLDPGLAPET